ncbi:MAG TPA: VWA domain-containing protein [Vicinamibacterales bacterium]|nr:VWA domain-containing protein [Vicinamibacterales bacterium]
MTAQIRRCAIPALLAPILALGSVTAGTQSAADKSIFVAVVDEAGTPVTDLSVEEFRIREDGVDRELTTVRRATQPLNVMLLGDTTQDAEPFARDIRVALTAFVRQTLGASPDSQISLMEFGQAAIAVTPFTKDAEALERGINKLVAKPSAASVLLEALIEASNTLGRRPSPRRAIVSLNLEPSNEQSREEPNRIIESLRRSVAQVWAVSLQNGPLRNPKRDVVLNQLTKNTGGRREFIVGQSALETILKSFADALTAQYEVIYKRPAGVRSAKIVQTGLTRQGLRLHASLYAPR